MLGEVFSNHLDYTTTNFAPTVNDFFLRSSIMSEDGTHEGEPKVKPTQ